MWGLKPHENVKFWWGARAIWDPPDRIDIPHDRQQIEGGTDEERLKLAKWVNATGMVKLKQELTRRGITRDQNCLVSIDDKAAGFFIMANPNSSYGYLYITAAPYSEV